MQTSISDNQHYPSFCLAAALEQRIFDNFRRNPVYLQILEHVTPDEGATYLEIIKAKYANLLTNLPKYLKNDTIGSPYTYDYGFGNISPTTLRYIKVLGEINKYCGDLTGLDVVEIGCGYGGQCKVILDTFNVKSYTLIDLNPVLSLTKKFLNSFDLDHSKIFYKTLADLDEKEYDLCISNYAFTECTKQIQREYLDKVILKSESGYITANFINDIFNLDYYTLEELVSEINESAILEEEPKTSDKNKIIIW